MRSSDIHLRWGGATPSMGPPSVRSGTATVLAALALVVAACGEPGIEAGAADPPEQEEPAEEEPGEAPPEGEEPAEEVAPPAEEDGADEEPAEEAPDEEACALPVGDGTPMDPDDYLDLVGPINGSLEELAFAMDASLVALEEGGDGPTLEDELTQHRETWEELVAPVVDLTPPEGAEDWHDDLVDSWVAVCEAIDDGYHGSADGDDERFEDFVDALRDFPSLVNHLHANAACGPFETC